MEGVGRYDMDFYDIGTGYRAGMESINTDNVSEQYG